MNEYYDRYAFFRENGQVISGVPFIDIPSINSDIYVIYRRDRIRMDTLSYKYYGNPNYGWLILQANPQYGGFEFKIPQGAQLRVPYPLDSALDRYEDSCKDWINKH